MIPLRLKKQATNMYVCSCSLVYKVYKEFLQIHKKKKTQGKKWAKDLNKHSTRQKKQVTY